MMSSLLPRNWTIFGLGASVALAAGSWYFISSTCSRDYFAFRKNKFLKSMLNDNLDEDLDFITAHKEVPAFLFKQTNGFSTIVEKSGSLVNIIEHDSETDSYSAKSRIRYITIEGYRADVNRVTAAIDRLIADFRVDQFQIFEIRSSQVKSILGHRNSIIAAIEHESGAKISFGISDRIDGNGGNIFTSVKICGTGRQIRDAYRLIDSHLQKDRQFQSNRNLPPISTFHNFDDKEEKLLTGDNKRREYLRNISAETMDSGKSFRKQADFQPNLNDCGGDDGRSRRGSQSSGGGHNHHRLLPIVDLSSENSRKFRDLKSLCDFTERLSPMIDHDDRLMPPLDVFVSNSENPQDFYIHIADSRSQKLDRLFADLKDFFAIAKNRKSCRIDASAFKENINRSIIGEIVAVTPAYDHPYFHHHVDDDEEDVDPEQLPDYYRVYVMDYIVESGLYEIYYVDFGFLETCPLSSLYTLNDNFLNQLPFQAIRCRLFGVAPTGVDSNGKEEWSTQAIDAFRRFTFEGLWNNVTRIYCHSELEDGSYQVEIICRETQFINASSSQNSSPFSSLNSRNVTSSGAHKSTQFRYFDLASELIRLGLAKKDENCH